MGTTSSKPAENGDLGENPDTGTAHSGCQSPHINLIGENDSLDGSPVTNACRGPNASLVAEGNDLNDHPARADTTDEHERTGVGNATESDSSYTRSAIAASTAQSPNLTSIAEGDSCEREPPMGSNTRQGLSPTLTTQDRISGQHPATITGTWQRQNPSLLARGDSSGTLPLTARVSDSPQAPTPSLAKVHICAMRDAFRKRMAEGTPAPTDHRMAQIYQKMKTQRCEATKWVGIASMIVAGGVGTSEKMAVAEEETMRTAILAFLNFRVAELDFEEMLARQFKGAAAQKEEMVVDLACQREVLEEDIRAFKCVQETGRMPEGYLQKDVR